MSSLLDLLRATPGTPDALRSALAALDEEELVAKCARHGLSGLADYHLRQAGLALSEPAAGALRRGAMSTAVLGIKVKKLLLQSLDALARRNIVPVVLKGYGLALRCYPDPLYRPMTDVDLLIAREELPAAEAALAEIGVRKNEPLENYQLAHHHHLNFYGALGSVELHFRAITGFGGAIEADDLLARSLEGRLEDRWVRYLGSEDELVYLATHATQHLFKGVGWLYDLKLFIRRYPCLDWGAVIAVARQTGMQAPVYFALQTAHRALAAEVPEGVLAQLRPALWQVLLGNIIFSRRHLVDRSFAELRYSWMVRPFLASNLLNVLRSMLFLGWRAPLRKLARHFPNMVPAHWRA